VNVAVCWAGPERQMLRALHLPAGACIADALAALHAELTREDPALASSIDWQGATVGIHGAGRERSAELRDGDRIEIYRPLQRDPKEGRRQRAQRLRAGRVR